MPVFWAMVKFFINIMAKDGGLLTPFYIPKLPGKALDDMRDMAYQHLIGKQLFHAGLGVVEVAHHG